MAAQTGRTVNKWVGFYIHDTSGTLRAIPINTLSVVGIVYDEQNLTAFQDAVNGVLPNMPDAPIDIGGPFDTITAQASPTLSGSHTVLAGLNGETTPRTIDVEFGIRHAFEEGEPQFGITATAANGYICTNYTVNPSDMTYSASFRLYPGSAIPAWGTTSEA